MNGLVMLGLYKKILVIGVEVMLKIIDYMDWVICVLFGDGVGVMFVEYDEYNLSFLGCYYGMDGSGGVNLYCFNLFNIFLGKEINLSGNLV